MEEITGLLNKDNMDALVAAVSAFGLKLLAAIVVFVVGRWLVGRVTRLLEAGMKRADTDPTLISFFRNIIYFGLLTMVVIAAVSQLGVQTTSFIAVLGAAGLAIGLALQGSLANFAAGVLMIIFRPFKAGDYVEVAGVAGSVEELHLFTTKLRTPDNKIIIIPNAQVTNEPITNYSALDTRRLDLQFGVSYSDDLDHVRRVIKEVLDAEERLLEDPAPTIGLLTLGDNSVNFAVRPWVRSSDYWGVYFDLQEAMKKRFDKEGISIPFPQRDVHLHQVAS
ncbi:mechanosensitive ion channel domain-containing protein [Wenzhouxiangella sp. XN24]|uniref:mechanosensitive ion channel family protein n=1 Tax=Wenzhouxiangella sp. XN24 TaxID=2713569 RepID=UPI0013EBCBA2|nr:mechanosensitive ion channel domain-containing protein [Wenzhouxiangella sp. XN24]NGX15667.1 mechanosensitive ion channel [Wenzhouxiangella sp. XN24]